jgi:peptidoglycan/LPS O-acetylase OafA/YrhL
LGSECPCPGLTKLRLPNNQFRFRVKIPFAGLATVIICPEVNSDQLLTAPESSHPGTDLPEENSSRVEVPLPPTRALSLGLQPLGLRAERLTELAAPVAGEQTSGTGVALEPAESTAAPQTRIPSLDGFRAMSIIMVLLHHATKTAFFPAKLTAVLKYAINGNLGVRIFFVISGLLITTLLLKEEAGRGKISLRLFYERRAARILPVYWSYILAVLVYAAVCGWIVPFRPFAEALSFSTSWFHTHQWVFEHSWSLSVEEMFYLLWPLALTRLRHEARITVALMVIVAGPVLRALLYNFYGGEEYFSRFSLGILGNVDPIMWGCLLALIRHRNPELLQRLGGWRPFLSHSMFALMMLALIRLNRPAYWYLAIPFTVTVSCLGVVYLVNYHCFISCGVGFRFLNHAWIARVGILSYSIYLWQQLFLQPAAAHRFWWQAYPANLPLSLLAACASYYLLERPFLRLRSRLRAGIIRLKEVGTGSDIVSTHSMAQFNSLCASNCHEGVGSRFPTSSSMN